MSTDDKIGSTKAKALGNSLLVQAWDSANIDGVVAHFASDAMWTVNTSAPARGHGSIRELSTGLRGLSGSSRHFDLDGFTSADGRLVSVRGQVEYARGDSPPTTCSFCDIFELDDVGKITKGWTYMDTAPLAPPAPEK